MIVFNIFHVSLVLHWYLSNNFVLYCFSQCLSVDVSLFLYLLYTCSFAKVLLQIYFKYDCFFSYEHLQSSANPRFIGEYRIQTYLSSDFFSQ